MVCVCLRGRGGGSRGRRARLGVVWSRRQEATSEPADQQGGGWRPGSWSGWGREGLGGGGGGRGGGVEKTHAKEQQLTGSSSLAA